MKIRLMCPKCGLLRRVESYDHSYDICEYCKTITIKIDIDEETDILMSNATQDEMPTLRERVWRKHLYNDPQFNEATFEARLKSEKAMYDAIIERVAKLPKCPTCGSTNIRHIGTGERAVSVIGLGLFSGKIGKNYECLNCKARW